MSWRYERGEGRLKHCWGKPSAGFVPSGKGAIGKCSSELTDSVAQALLEKGVPLFEFDEDTYPSKIFNVYNGVIYEAVPTVPGRSYHGYPWRGPRPPLKIVEKLAEAARAGGCEAEFKRWLKKNSK